VGVHPPPSPAWANFTLMTECTPESSRCYSVYSVVPDKECHGFLSLHHGIQSDVRLEKPAIDTAVAVFPGRIRHSCVLAHANAAAIRRCRRRRRRFLVVFKLQNLGNGPHRKPDAGPTRCDVTASASVNIAVGARRFSEKDCAVGERQRQFDIASVVVVTNALLLVEDFVPLDFFNPDGGGELGFSCRDYQRLLA
jgi:hypothetical protein